LGRLPVFFIQLKNPSAIKKLYQSGEYKEELVDTRGEMMVAEMLQGKRDPFAYPQYNCCGGNDIIPSLPVIHRFLPPRVYLGDFSTEIEHVFLVRNAKSDIVGGLVCLYGD
ncbi:MAG: hypothetical protein N3A54_05435, partial [Patescibacteria group bacterium]|nr:hypothetical protein [Patescibacteria group bacterium]